VCFFLRKNLKSRFGEWCVVWTWNVAFPIPFGLSVARNKVPLDKSSLLIILRLLTNTSVIHRQVPSSSEYFGLTTGTPPTSTLKFCVLPTRCLYVFCVIRTWNGGCIRPYTAFDDWALNCGLWGTNEFLRTFAKLRKATIRFVMSICLSVTTLFPLDGF